LPSVQVADVVTKTYEPGSVDAARREWHALQVLATLAPDLSPAPLAADLDGERPVIVMTRVPAAV
jgi:hypothetical protein